MGWRSAASFLKRNILFPLKLVVGLACLAGFGYQISFILDQFINKETNTSIDYVQHESMILPVVSICSTLPFKSGLNTTSEKEFFDNTQDFTEMFHMENLDIWNVTEFRSFLMGRCYSFTTNKPVPSVSLDQVIKIRHKNDLNVYVHQEEEQFWLWYLLTPVGFAANSIPHDGNIDLHLYKKVVTILKRKDNCREYEDETLGFTMCSRDKIREVVLETLNCTTHALNWFLGPELSLKKPMCEDANTFGDVDQKAADTIQEFTQSPGKYGCTLPCSTTKYLTRTNHFPEPHPNKSDPILNMYVYYDTLLVENQREVLMYDIPAFLSAAGGTLGLYLGFSIFSILVGLMKVTLNKKEEEKAGDDASVKVVMDTKENLEKKELEAERSVCHSATKDGVIFIKSNKIGAIDEQGNLHELPAVQDCTSMYTYEHYE